MVMSAVSTHSIRDATGIFRQGRIPRYWTVPLPAVEVEVALVRRPSCNMKA
jgi:hypothetical protein